MNRRGGNRAFTLLELLVAAAISLLLSGLVLSVVVATLRLWQRTQDGFAAATQAQLALDLLERDLQSAVLRIGRGPVLALDHVEDAGQLARHGWLTAAPRLKPAGGPSRHDPGPAGRIGEARFGRGGAWLRFVTTNVETAGSLPVVVAWQIARRPLAGPIAGVNPAPVRYTLFRAAVTAEETLANGYAMDAGRYGSTRVEPAGTREPATVTNPNAVDALATNVVDFGVWLHAREGGGGLRRVFPVAAADAGYALHVDASAAGAGGLPVVADVMIRILSEDGARQIEQIESGAGSRPPGLAADAEWWWAVVEANSRVFVRRIELGRARP